MYNLSKRVGEFTQLETAAHTWKTPYRILEAEAWQMGLYGSGGHYLPHYDAFEKHVMPPDTYWNGLWVGNR